jgi:hypothetical protein
MTLPQVPIPAGVPTAGSTVTLPYPDGKRVITEEAIGKNLIGADYINSVNPGETIYLNRAFAIPATSIDPSRLKSFKKAVKLAKPMGGK